MAWPELSGSKTVLNQSAEMLEVEGAWEVGNQAKLGREGGKREGGGM